MAPDIWTLMNPSGILRGVRNQKGRVMDLCWKKCG